MDDLKKWLPYQIVTHINTVNPLKIGRVCLNKYQKDSPGILVGIATIQIFEYNLSQPVINPSARTPGLLSKGD